MNKISPRPHMAYAAVICFFAVPFTACGGPQLNRYDATTYQNLTYEKPEVLALYDSFGTDPINDGKVNDVGLKLSQIHEYEAGKGAGNIDMTHQVESIQKLFQKHVSERRRDGAWNATNLTNHKETISEAFDIAIKTEQAKNK